MPRKLYPWEIDVKTTARPEIEIERKPYPWETQVEVEPEAIAPTEPERIPGQAYWEPPPTGAGAVRSFLAGLQFQEPLEAEPGTAEAIPEYPERLPSLPRGISEALKSSSRALKRKYPENKILGGITDAIERDISNLPDFLSPDLFWNFLLDIAIRPKDVWDGLSGAAKKVLLPWTEGGVLTKEAWTEGMPVTDTFMVWMAGKGAKHVAKKVAPGAIGLKKRFPWEKKAEVPKEITPRQREIGAVRAAIKIKQEGGVPKSLTDLLREIKEPEFAISERARPQVLRRPSMEPGPGQIYEGAFADAMAEVNKPVSTGKPVEPEIMISERGRPQVMGRPSMEPGPGRMLEGAFADVVPEQAPLGAPQPIAGLPEVMPEGFVPPGKLRLPRVERGFPEGFVPPEKIVGMEAGFRKAKVIPPREAGIIEPELFIKPLEMLYSGTRRGAMAFKEWYFEMSLEARQQWWADHVTAKAMQPLPVGWYEKGPLTFGQWKSLERSRQFMFTNAKTNPEYIKAVLGQDANPRLLYETVIKPSIERNAIEMQVAELGKALEKAPIEIRRHFGDLAEAGISKQQFIDRAGTAFGEMPAKLMKESLDMIVDWADQLNQRGMLLETSRSKWENPYYFTRTYMKHQSLKGLRRTFDNKFGPGSGAAVERLYQKNLIKNLEKYIEMKPEARREALNKLDRQSRKDVAFIINNNLISASEWAARAMKETQFVQNLIGRLGYNKNLRIDIDLLKGRGKTRVVSEANIETWKERGYEIRSEVSSGEYTIEKTNKAGKVQKREKISGERLAPLQAEGWSVVKQTKAKTFDMWRDYSKPERQMMGEIMDVDYKLATTMMRTHQLVTNMKTLDTIANPANKWSMPDPVRIENRIKALESVVEARGGLKEKINAKRVKEINELQTELDGINEIKEHGAKYGVEWKQVPNATQYGAMKGKIAPDFVYDLITKDMKAVDGFAKVVARKYYSMWKKSKTIYNPATHVRNFLFNGILADLGGVSMFRKSDWQYFDYARKELLKEFKKPGSSEFVKSIKDTGVDIFRSGWSKEFGEYLSAFDKHMKREGIPANQLYEGVEAFWDKTAGRAGRGATAAYAFSETYFKAVVIAKQMRGPKLSRSPADILKGREGMPINRTWTDAANHAQKYLFDYGNVAPIVDILRSIPVVGSPFATFYSKLAPLFLENIATQPVHIVKYFLAAEAIQKFAQHYYGITDEEAEIINRARMPWHRNHVGRMKSMMVPYVDKITGKPDTIYSYDIGFLNPLADPIEIIKNLVPFINDPLTNAMLTQWSRKRLGFSNKEIIDDGPALQQPYLGQRIGQLVEQAAPIPALFAGGRQAGGKLYRGLEMALTGETSAEWWGGQRSPILQITDAILGQKIRPEVTEISLENNIDYMGYKHSRLISEWDSIENGNKEKYLRTDGTINKKGIKRQNELVTMMEPLAEEIELFEQMQERLYQLRAQKSRERNVQQ